MILCTGCNNPLDAPDMKCGVCGATHEVEPGIYSFIPESRRRPDVGYRDSFFDTNAQTEARHFWFLGRNGVACRLVRSHLAPGSRFLEIGCGTGNMLRRLARMGYEVQGTDISRPALRFAKSRHDTTFYEADINGLPFVEHFPAAGLFDVLEHIEDHAHALARVRHTLEPGGLLFITVPAGSHLFSSYDELLCHKRRYDMAPLRDLVYSAGFSVLKATYFFCLLYPLLAATRKNRDARTEPAPGDAGKQLRDELRIYPVVNEVFRAVMACEAQLVRFMDFPIGGSIAMVAKKM